MTSFRDIVAVPATLTFKGSSKRHAYIPSDGEPKKMAELLYKAVAQGKGNADVESFLRIHPKARLVDNPKRTSDRRFHYEIFYGNYPEGRGQCVEIFSCDVNEEAKWKRMWRNLRNGYKDRESISAELLTSFINLNYADDADTFGVRKVGSVVMTQSQIRDKIKTEQEGIATTLWRSRGRISGAGKTAVYHHIDKLNELRAMFDLDELSLADARKRAGTEGWEPFKGMDEKRREKNACLVRERRLRLVGAEAPTIPENWTLRYGRRTRYGIGKLTIPQLQLFPTFKLNI